MMSYNRIAAACFLFLLALRLQAGDFSQQWQALPDVKFYEYEIAEHPSFSDESLVRQGRVNEASLRGRLGPGIYYLRVRGVAAENVSRWTGAKKFKVGGAKPQLLFPRPFQSVELSGKNSPLVFEWESSERVDDYVLEVVPVRASATKPFSSKTSGHTLETRSVTEGEWKARVVGRIKGQSFVESDWVHFDVKYVKLPKPWVMEPQNDQVLPASEVFRVRWKRNLAGERSAVYVLRLGSKKEIVSFTEVEGQNYEVLPRLLPGRYQIVIRDYLEESQEFAQSAVHVVVKHDPLSVSSRKIGTSLRFLGGVKSGWDAQKNFSTGGWVQNSADVTPAFDVRLAGKMFRSFGFELSYAGEFPEYQQDGNEVKSMSEDFSFGVSFQQLVWGFQNWFRYKALLSYGQVPMLMNDENNTRFVLWSFKPAVEFFWGSWRSFWDFSSELQLSFPLSSSGSVLGTGSPRRFLPSFKLTTLLRRQTSDTWRLAAGPYVFFESLKVAESEKSDSFLQRAQLGFQLGLEWDL